MNGMSIGELCHLFCWPPLPSSIVAKLAFLPPPPTYKLNINDSEQTNSLPINSENCAVDSSFVENSPNKDVKMSETNSCMCTKLFKCHKEQSKPQNPFIFNNAQIELGEKSEWQYGPRELEKLEAFTCKTDQGHKIACLFVRCTNTPKYTILYSHGNAVDIGQMSSFYYGLGSRLDCNIFTYDYSGYGQSSGQATEKNLYSDIETAWHALRSRYGVSPSNIILYGQSIGTVPTVDLASKYDSAGVVLHAPLMSGMRVAFNTTRTYCCDAFPSIEKINKIRSLVLVIHGTEDEVIDLSHGVTLHEKCQNPVEPLWVEGAGHNDIEIFSQYVDRLKRFINFEIPNHQTKVITTANTKDNCNESLKNNQKPLNKSSNDSNICINAELNEK